MLWTFRWIGLWIVGLVAFVILAVVTHRQLDLPSFQAFAQIAAMAGKWIAIGAGVVLAGDVMALVAYTIRRSQTHTMEKNTITSHRALNLEVDNLPRVGRSKIKMLGSRSSFVTAQSLVDGSATRGERLMVLGIVAMFVAFGLIFVGWGLMLMKSLPLIDRKSTRLNSSH